MSVNEAIKEVQDIIIKTGARGCITGSSMIPGEDFSLWDEVPDVDLFVYTKPQLQDIAKELELLHGFKPMNDANAWKWDRMRHEDDNYKTNLMTLKMKAPNGIVANISWKKGKTNIADVLASFDMTIIMVGYDIPNRFYLDLRTAVPGAVVDPEGRWSPSIKVAVPNPMRRQDVDMYGTAMWARQFNRVIKYWNRGYDTRPMARFYIEKITKVIDTGKLFDTDNGEQAFNEFVEEFEPERARMIEWLRDKEDTCD